MNWYKKSQTKILYIMRGLSGSGKSTLAKELRQGGIILSTDDFFMVGGKYQFDRDYMADAHYWNQVRAEEAMKDDITPIVIDNTNVQAWEAKPYVEKALRYGYKIEIAEPNTPWKFNAEELAKRNTHKVPLEVIHDMLAKWETDITVEDIMESQQTPKK